MGFPLYREVYNYAPADLSSPELIVALMIADDANDDTRESWIALQELCRRARMSAVSVRRALGNLGKRGLEFRVIHGYGKDGRPVFAARGHAVDYRVPVLTVGAQIRSPLEAIGAQERAANGWPVDNERRSGLSSKALTSVLKGAQIRAPLSSVSPQISSATPCPVVTPSVEGNGAGHGGASRQPIELQAWIASLEARKRGR